jgi:hypothetical protein
MKKIIFSTALIIAVIMVVKQNSSSSDAKKLAITFEAKATATFPVQPISLLRKWQSNFLAK